MKNVISRKELEFYYSALIDLLKQIEFFLWHVQKQ